MSIYILILISSIVFYNALWVLNPVQLPWTLLSCTLGYARNFFALCLSNL